MDTVNTELIRGHVDTIILNSLAERDRYGYEILDIISDLSEGRYEIKQPTLYSCLKRLEKQGFITSYFGDESNGGRRRYYQLTQKGKETLEQDQREWEFSRTIINKLLSDKEIDLKTVEAPFDPNELRPLTRRVKAHEPQEEVAATVAPVSQEPIVKYVYIPQYVHVPESKPLPQNGTLPEGAQFAEEKDLPEEVKIAPISFNPIISEEKEDIPTPTQQEALRALYSDEVVDNFNAVKEENVSEENITSVEDAEEKVVNESNTIVEDAVEDEETALLVKEQQTKASKLLGIGEFATHRNLLEVTGVAEEGQNSTDSYENRQEIPYSAPTSSVEDGESINYREALSAFFGTAKAQGDDKTLMQASATYQAEAERLENTAKARHFGDVKQSLYEEGFKLKVYQKANSINHYYMKFIYSNKINRDTAIFTYLLLVVELLIMIIAKKVFGNPIVYVIIGAVGILLPVIATIRWATNPTKRIRAQFNVNQSLSSACIAFIVVSAITIVVNLLLGADMKSGLTYSPIIIATIIPASVLIYAMLYKSNNYHLKK